jgi:hypothetical protein
VPPGQFLASIGVHLPPPQSVLAMRRYDLPPPPLVPLEPAANYTTLSAPQPMVGPQSAERVAGFGATAQRQPGKFEPAEGDGPWRNAAAGFSEAFYGMLGSAVDDQVVSVNSQIEDTNFLLGRNDPYIPEDQILGSRWFARKAEDKFGVPDPARVHAVTGWEKAARIGSAAAGHLAAALLLPRRAPVTATRGPSLPNVHPPRLGTDLPGQVPGRQVNPIEGGDAVRSFQGYDSRVSAPPHVSSKKVEYNYPDSTPTRRAPNEIDRPLVVPSLGASSESAVRGPYANLQDSSSVGVGKDFTRSQKRRVLKQNIQLSGGVIRSDNDGGILSLPKKHRRGETPPDNEAQIDHIIPKKPRDPSLAPGSNSFSNAQVLSRAQNRAKSNRKSK